MLEGALRKAQTASEFVALMRKLGGFGDATAMMRFEKIYSDAMDHLVALNPGPEDLRVWETKTVDTSLDVKLTEKVLRKATKAKTFVALMRDIQSWAGKYAEEYRAAYERVRPLLMALEPSPSELAEFYRKSGLIADPAGRLIPRPGVRERCRRVISRLSFGLIPPPQEN